jgi:hypothetical protein
VVHGVTGPLAWLTGARAGPKCLLRPATSVTSVTPDAAEPSPPTPADRQATGLTPLPSTRHPRRARPVDVRGLEAPAFGLPYPSVT